MTPYEAWTDKRPTVEHLRSFGCMAYSHIPKDERRKLDPKGKKCILLGYGTETKGYRLYDPNRGKVFRSRDVVFDETSYGFENSKEQNSQSVELECSNDETESTDEAVGLERVDAEDTTKPRIRRSTREKHPPKHYGEWATTVQENTEPTTVQEALAGREQSEWVEAMEQEISSLLSNDVWDLVELPENRKAVGSKWVFDVKVVLMVNLRDTKLVLLLKVILRSWELTMMKHSVQ